MTEQQANRSGVLVPLLAGMLGAGIALLIAPRSGQETREKMRGSAQDFKQQAQEKITTAKTEIGTEIEHARGLKQKLSDSIKAKGDKAGRTAQDMEQISEQQRPSQVLTSWDREV